MAVFYEPRLPFHPKITERFSNVDKSAWKVLCEAIFPTATEADSIVLALAYCRARGLDVFKRVIHIVPIWNKQLGKMVDTIWPGIGELRTTAHRTGTYAGCDETTFGPMLRERLGTVEMEFPEWAQVVVYKLMGGTRVPFVGPKVYWKETYATFKRGDDTPNDMWMNRPRGQLEKCFDEQTEVLTENGFEMFDSVSSRILQVADGCLVPCDAIPFSHEYDGEMVAFETKCLDFCVTPNHDMVTTDGKVEAGVMLRDATTTPKWRIPLAVDGSQPDYGVSDKQIQVAAIVICDGYRRGNGWSVAVSRDRKVAHINSLGMHRSHAIRKCAGDESQLGGRVVVTRKDKVVFSFDGNAGGDLLTVRDDRKSLDTSVILKLSQRQARLFVDTMIAFDGNQNSTARRFYSSREDVMSAFELACVVAGLSVSHRTFRYTDGAGPNMAVTVSKKRAAPIVNTRSSRVVAKPNGPRGKVWCCRVPSGVIVVRRNGMSMLCGNCAEAAALRKAFPEELGGDMIPEEVERSAVMGTIQPKMVTDAGLGQTRGSQLAQQLREQHREPVTEYIETPRTVDSTATEREPGDESGPAKTGPVSLKAQIAARINVATSNEQLTEIESQIGQVEPPEDREGLFFALSERHKQLAELAPKGAKGQLPLS